MFSWYNHLLMFYYSEQSELRFIIQMYHFFFIKNFFNIFFKIKNNDRCIPFLLTEYPSYNNKL